MAQKHWRVAIPAPRDGETEGILTEAGCELIRGNLQTSFPRPARASIALPAENLLQVLRG
ncbi:MAG: hypothetical protein ACREQA_21270 [Candidatus Binatia bacterium]